ncbi:branched-chain amino acid ABC transporter permease [Stella sp.]|uniref:branched-chain amino acid ABC transporter permease n=1 Tax=Stella sp. TaxID=2912054 RepID=UPI0035B3C602
MVIQLLNGLQLAMLLFLLSVGLSVVFGLMRFVNLAHGTLFMLGAFVGLSTVEATGSFWWALAAGTAAAAVAGGLLYLGLLRHLQPAGPLKQVLVTFGLVFIGLEAARIVWGDYAERLPGPEVLAGATEIFGVVYPTYRLFVIALGLAVAALLHFGLERTRLGAVVRAGVDDRTMTAALGIDIDRVFFAVFVVGCALAGLAGVVAGPVLSVYAGMDMGVLILALVVVVVGGPGSLKGAFAGALLVGMAETFGQVWLPEVAGMLLYGLMAAVLVLRPQGLVPAGPRP